jgi:hypothetical protein
MRPYQRPRQIQNTQENHGLMIFRNKITPGSAPILFECSSSFRPEDAEIAEIVRCMMFFAIVDGVFASFSLHICSYRDQSGNGSYSAIDLTVTDPSLLLDFSWKVHDELCGNDHFPIILESLNSTVGERPTRY